MRLTFPLSPVISFAAGDICTHADFQKPRQSTSVFNFTLTPVPRLWRPHDLHVTAQPFSKIDLSILSSDFAVRLATLREKLP